MTLLKRRRVLAASIEATSGTAETLDASDASFNVYNITVSQAVEMQQREGQGGFARIASIAGGHQAKVTFTIDASWDGTATEPAWADTFLPCCGWVKTGQVYTPRSEAPGANVKTCTINVYTNGIMEQIYGAAGTFKLVCPTGRAAYFEFDFTGIWSGRSDAAILSPTYPDALPMRYAASTTTWNSVALCLENLTLDSANTIQMRECAANVGGYHAAIITDRQVKVTGNPEAKTVATQDRWGAFLASTESALTWDLDGPTNSKMTIAAPKAQVMNINSGDRNGLLTDEIEWQCNRNGSNVDQEASITFTAAT
jgi:hypothetical protein